MMGAAVVALAYALYKHFKPGAAKAAPATAQPSGGAAFAYGAPSPFTTLADLLSGAVHDIGSFDGQNYLGTIEAGPVVAGNGPRAPGALW
jgi:hypothetical protein